MRPQQTNRAAHPLWLKIEEAAALLGISRSTLYPLVSDGTIPSVHLGRSVLLPYAGLIGFARRMEQEQIGESITPDASAILGSSFVAEEKAA
jgi:excisionase family DNA binding protein